MTRITGWLARGEILLSEYGLTSVYSWLLMERLRLERNGIVAEVREQNGLVALYREIQPARKVTL